MILILILRPLSNYTDTDTETAVYDTDTYFLENVTTLIYIHKVKIFIL